uniref:Uncharacterized protein n=1 Tax=Knipowitschia caucasica TaxID=637954 RepID=A0AAV2M403_KNICA
MRAFEMFLLNLPWLLWNFTSISRSARSRGDPPDTTRGWLGWNHAVVEKAVVEKAVVEKAVVEKAVVEPAVVEKASVEKAVEEEAVEEEAVVVEAHMA